MVNLSSSLQRLMQRGCEFLGAPLAIMGGAMSWVSERHLVAAISNGGGFGTIACGAMTPDILRKEIQGTQDLTKKPFGVNLITMHPMLDGLSMSALPKKSGISFWPAACRPRPP